MIAPGVTSFGSCYAAWFPFFVPETGERAGITGYIDGTGTKRRRVALIRGMVERAVELGATFDPIALERVRADDDDADSIARRYGHGESSATVTVNTDGTFDYERPNSSGAGHSVKLLVLVSA